MSLKDFEGQSSFVRGEPGASLLMPSRRMFCVQMSAAVGFAALGLSPLRAKAAEPVRGGRLRVAMNSQSSNDALDPARFIYSNDYVRGRMFYNCLSRLAT